MGRNAVSLKSNKFLLVGVMLIIALLILYSIFNPEDYSWMPQCVFYKVTGLKCMGCGSQRMLYALLHGDFSGAFHHNMFLFISLPFIFMIGFAEVVRKKHPRFYARMHSIYIIAGFAVLLAIWFVVRNLLSL